MRVLEPKRMVVRRPKKRVSRWLKIICLALALLLFIGMVGTVATIWLRPTPLVDPSIKTVQAQKQNFNIPWPTIGQAAIGAKGYGVLDQHSDEQPRPMASINKVLTALAVLQKKPMSKGQTGPVITLTDDDVRLYKQYLEAGGSVTRVEVGEQITQYQVLQAMLLPSANNMADSLAIWAYGSMDQYLQAANNFALTLGMTKTKIADASGLSANTVSTPTDLIRLGEAAMNNDVVAEIVAQTTATLPVQGRVPNLNFLLGNNGTNGIKTGNTDEAGGCFLGSAQVDAPNNQKITVLVAVMAASNLEAVLRDSGQLLSVARSGFGSRELLAKGTVVGYYDVPWQGQILARSNEPITIFGWKNMPAKINVSLEPLRQQSANAKVGTVKAILGKQAITIDANIDETLGMPSLGWRFRHLLD